MNITPSPLRALACVLLLPWLVACKELPIEYPDPLVELPPWPQAPFLIGTNFSLAPYDYLQEEYFYSGEANAWTNLLPLDENGFWLVAPAERAAYKSRMAVYRPANPENFNGTVVIEWMNVTAGVDTATDWTMLHTELLRRGYAWVGISAQQIGIEGGTGPLPTPGLPLALKLYNPLRYGSLTHPGDSFSYDIFAQAAQAIRHPTGIAPLGELNVERVIAMGESQSATRLVTFANAFGHRTDLFDGYYIHSRLGSIRDFGGASAPLSQSPQAEITTPDVVRIRRDLRKPVMNLQTETDVLPLDAVTSRQRDNPWFRLWEVAGTAHADYYTITQGADDQGDVSSAEVIVTNRPSPFLPACPEPTSSAPQHHFVGKAALFALNRWLADGIRPASAKRLAVNDAGNRFLYDDLGNVLDGVRSPYVDAPIAVMSGENASGQNSTDICFLFGKTEFLSDAVLQSLYPDHAAYVVAVSDAARDAVAKGFLLEEDAELIIQAAEASSIPPP